MMTSLIRRAVMVGGLLALAGVVLVDSNRVSSRVSKDPVLQIPIPEPEESDKDPFRARTIPVPAGAIEEAWSVSMAAVASASEADAPTTVADHWTNIGPAPINGEPIEGGILPLRATGRIVAIAADPNPLLVATHWFIAADTGGIWETANGGTSWVPRSDGELSLAMNTITIAPSNSQILFATTRDASGSVLKSTNGGSSWTRLPVSFPNSGRYFYFTAVQVHPTDSNTVLIMTSQEDSPENGGIFKSGDGGATFCRTRSGPGTSLQINPVNFNQQIAGIRNAQQGLNNGFNGIFRSMDGGETWNPLSGPWDNAILNTGGAVRIAIAPSNPSRVYVVVAGAGMWQSQNAWASSPTWDPIQPTVSGQGYPVTFFAMVDPADDDIFYVGGQGGVAELGNGFAGFYRYSSVDQKWTRIIPSTHVDQHALAAAGNTLLLGNDGGFWTSTDQGSSWINKNSNLSIVQFYAGSLHPTNANAALAGSQDNGTELWSGNPAWDSVGPGDGLCTAFSFSNPDNWLIQANGQYGNEVLRIIGGIGHPIEYAGPFDPPGFHAGISRVKRSPNSDVILAGSTKLWKSANFFAATPPTWTVNGPAADPSGISAIAFAPSLPSKTYAFGTGGGALWLTINAGGEQAVRGEAPWKNLDPSGMVPNRAISAIAFHPNDPATIYVALNGFDADTPGSPGHIFKTTNAAAPTPTWSNVTPPGPSPSPSPTALNLPVNVLAVDPDPSHPNTIYAGTDLGVWKSTSGGDSWTFMGPGSGMPNVLVYDMQFSPADGHLVAFTHGRGAFRLNAGTAETGSVQVTLLPIIAGAQWKVDSGAFQNSGTTLSGLSTGTHTVSFKSVSGYSTPASQVVGVNANQTTTSSGVYSPPACQLANISTRADVGTGDNVAIGGFIITGSTCLTKTVVIRGMGPSTGVNGYLSDPYIELHKPNGTTISNNNYMDASNWHDIPAYLVPGDSRESVILTTLGPGSYTVILRGANGETGVGLFEAYDLEPTSALKLTNISTRAFVQKGDDVMIGGLIFGPSGSKTVVIRGLGPTTGVSGYLSDPLLELHKADGSVVTNDNWQDAPNWGEIPVNLRPSYSSESVILTTLGPGLHTVIVKGASGETGVGIFEAYPLDN